MTLDRAAFLDALLARLGAHDVLAPLQNERFPADFDEWMERRLKSPKGAFLVSYAGSRRLPGGESSAPVSVAADVVLLARPGGPTPEALLAAVEEQLDGHRLKLSTTVAYDLFIESDAFTDERDRTQIYAVRVRGDLL